MPSNCDPPRSQPIAIGLSRAVGFRNIEGHFLMRSLHLYAYRAHLPHVEGYLSQLFSTSASPWTPSEAVSAARAANDSASNPKLDHSAHQQQDELSLPNHHTTSTSPPPTNHTSPSPSSRKERSRCPENSSQPAVPTKPPPNTSQTSQPTPSTKMSSPPTNSQKPVATKSRCPKSADHSSARV